MRLRGKSLGSGVALGSASVLRAPHGIPLLPARMVAQMARTPADMPIDPMEVVLVARDYQVAVSLALPWAKIVGIVAEFADPMGARLPVPAVIGIEGVLDKIDDESLVLIDGDRGVVMVDPDSVSLAHYQAEQERISPRRRLYLDYAHQSAQTLDGREIHVLAQVATPEDVQLALDQGADVLYASSETEMISGDSWEDEQYDALVRLAEMAGGKPITLSGDLETVSPTALLRAAIRAEFTLALPMAYGVEGFNELQTHLQEARESLLDEDMDFSDFRLAGRLPLLAPLPDELADFSLSRIVVEGIGQKQMTDEERLWFNSLTLAAKRLLLPVEVVIIDTEATSLPSQMGSVIGLDASGIIVPPATVQSTKEAIRGLDSAACREALIG